MEIEFKITPKDIVITIPKDTLLFALENHPEFPLVVHDRDRFIKLFVEQLEEQAGYDPDLDLSGFKQLLDKAGELVAESGDYCCDLKEEIDQ